ncbi:zinc finger, RING/FYVE/PHD-type containing protein [Tanacetum coccineum]
MGKTTSCSYKVISPHLKKIVIVNQRRNDENVDKVMLWGDSGVTVHDYNEHITKSILFEDGLDYTRYRMSFTRRERSVHTIKVYDMHDELLDDEDFRLRCVSFARFILWYEILPFNIGKKKSNGGVSKDKEGEICPICYDEYQADQMIGTLACRHSYHEGCIKTWLSRKNVCPMCRNFTKSPKLYRTCSDAAKVPRYSLRIQRRSTRLGPRPAKFKRICVKSDKCLTI